MELPEENKKYKLLPKKYTIDNVGYPVYFKPEDGRTYFYKDNGYIPLDNPIWPE